MRAPEVALRPLQPDDSPTLYRWRNSSEVARWMYTDHRIGEEEHARWFAGAAADPGRVYRVIEADGRPVGLVNLYDVDQRRRCCSWAYYLGEGAARGRGLGAFVEYVVIEHVFGAMGFHKLWCEVLIDNEPVWRLHESFGFSREAMFRDHVLKAGSWTDVVGLGLLRDDWLSLRQSCRSRLERRGFDLGARV